MPTTSLIEGARAVPDEVLEQDPRWWESALNVLLDLNAGEGVTELYVMFAEYPCYCESIPSENHPCLSCLSQTRLASRRQAYSL